MINRKIQKEGHTGLVSNVKKRFDCVVRVEVRVANIDVDRASTTMLSPM